MAKMIECDVCKNEMASSAKVCPNCGAKNKKPIYKKWWFWAIIVIIVVSIASSTEDNSSSKTEPNKVVANKTEVVKEENQSEKEVVEKKNSPTISKAEFEALSTGITYEKAVEIIGGEGELSSQVDVGGYDTRLYIWKGEGSFGANANVTFQNGKLVSKAQLGLK